EEAHVGRRGRNRSVAVYEFTREAAGVTEVELTTYSEPATLIDRVRQTGAAGWLKRNSKMALERLRLIFEEPPEQPLARASVAVLAGCGSHGQGVKEPAREGLSLGLAGIDYNVFITRELNPQIPPDSAYYKGPLAKKGEALYGVFLQACNHGKHPLPTARRFTVRDNQGNEFHPTPLPA